MNGSKVKLRANKHLSGQIHTLGGQIQTFCGQIQTSRCTHPLEGPEWVVGRGDTREYYTSSTIITENKQNYYKKHLIRNPNGRLEKHFVECEIEKVLTC